MSARVEGKIEQALVKLARKSNIWPAKVVLQGQAGSPDRWFLTPDGDVFMIEVKAPGQKPSPLQVHFMKELRARDFACTWIDNAEDAGRAFADAQLLTPRKFNETWPVER